MAATTLNTLNPGQTATVTAVTGDPAVVQRLAEFGLFEGETIELLGRAPLGDPIEVRVGQSRVSLRLAEARGVEINPK
jgi:ferrous iron transport protein A